MATPNVCPNADGEGKLGRSGRAWQSLDVSKYAKVKDFPVPFLVANSTDYQLVNLNTNPTLLGEIGAETVNAKKWQAIFWVQIGGATNCNVTLKVQKGDTLISSAIVSISQMTTRQFVCISAIYETQSTPYASLYAQPDTPASATAQIILAQMLAYELA